ncbi:hypothetical protein [Streptomyces sp. Je 1-369]|uniref:hypothetical protein n=1 Tax=Streptomyces sp. Je 1-369 TaxID=2966192 RepID=UPI0022857827|nr:hypothetical protein [Streptomyces sp. Je 1-369]WAL93944.1 hypothetical protein NOO62_05195 [Streptomyces sp. Je 1-369]
MTAYDRLAAEEIPTGTFGHAQPQHAPEGPSRPPATWTPIQQAQHRADLLTALTDWAWDEDTRDAERRHLRLIANETNTNAA